MAEKRDLSQVYSPSGVTPKKKKNRAPRPHNNGRKSRLIQDTLQVTAVTKQQFESNCDCVGNVIGYVTWVFVSLPN